MIGSWIFISCFFLFAEEKALPTAERRGSVSALFLVSDRSRTLYLTLQPSGRLAFRGGNLLADCAAKRYYCSYIKDSFECNHTHAYTICCFFPALHVVLLLY